MSSRIQKILIYNTKELRYFSVNAHAKKKKNHILSTRYRSYPRKRSSACKNAHKAAQSKGPTGVVASLESWVTVVVGRQLYYGCEWSLVCSFIYVCSWEGICRFCFWGSDLYLYVLVYISGKLYLGICTFQFVQQKVRPGAASASQAEGLLIRVVINC